MTQGIGDMSPIEFVEAEVESGTSAEQFTGLRLSLQQKVVTFLAADLSLFFICGFLPYAWGVEYSSLDDKFLLPTLATVLYVILGRLLRSFNSRKILDRTYTVPRQLTTIAATFAILIFIAVATKTAQNYSRLWFMSWMALTLMVLPLARIALLSRSQRQLETGCFIYRALSVSVFSQPLPATEIARLSAGQVKIVDTLRLGDIAELESLAEIITRDEIDQIYLSTPWVDAPALLPKLRGLQQLSVDVFVLPLDNRLKAEQLDLTTFGDKLSMRAVQRPINGWNLWLKRVQDVTVASLSLLVFAPAMILIAAAIKLESPGPVLFRQKRVGFNGTQFELLKFRSMRQEASDLGALRQTSKDDDRVTIVGRFIRRTSFDEMPQFINVLRGDMSVVGPRPHALQTRAKGVDLCDISDQYAARHRVKPGLTGWAQVNGYRGELDSFTKVQKRVEYDMEYISNWSTWLDMKIIVRTALLLVYDPAAY
ncbi:hypothetical protein CCR94_16035 [Rhodoblastus sphagnicola]|uniref:Bacterial sugar transferase domain-containing protein n=1 Tax=Rhodoblastus sphagnicola TaxID=333368 RepID=A0A2S6N3B8_9HYPH|nr:exopolysaccharide biosynthesis polyprenyl glycosylphosphotransferase [Rhodoblastus sphagnicola]MBB4200845.1 Undecaprenyl-phosphate glucose phosphotransferase [Rhodoblastus sphagnicola]PPQ29109.1 hypothetical protein CCR94_16035 [Rhodoblastus sphagnicola]